MNKKTIGLIIIIVGGIIAVVSLTADYIGLGTYPGINYAQLTTATLGLLIILVGIWLRSAKRSIEKIEEEVVVAEEVEEEA